MSVSSNGGGTFEMNGTGSTGKGKVRIAGVTKSNAQKKKGPYSRTLKANQPYKGGPIKVGGKTVGYKVGGKNLTSKTRSPSEIAGYKRQHEIAKKKHNTQKARMAEHQASAKKANRSTKHKK